MYAYAPLLRGTSFTPLAFCGTGRHAGREGREGGVKIPDSSDSSYSALLFGKLVGAVNISTADRALIKISVRPAIRREPRRFLDDPTLSRLAELVNRR